MRKRYVFWRTPEGKPSRRNDDKHAPTALLEQFGKTARVTDSQIQWVDYFIHRTHVALQSAVVVVAPDEQELNGTDSWDLVRQALIAMLKISGGGHALQPS